MQDRPQLAVHSGQRTTAAPPAAAPEAVSTAGASEAICQPVMAGRSPAAVAAVVVEAEREPVAVVAELRSVDSDCDSPVPARRRNY